MNPIQQIKAIDKIDGNIHSSLGKEEMRALYDNKAKLYEKVVSSHLYNKIMWGASPTEYKEFSSKAILESKGIGLDIACGGLIQTAEFYHNTNNQCILLDNSIEMLKIGKSKT